MKTKKHHENCEFKSEKIHKPHEHSHDGHDHDHDHVHSHDDHNKNHDEDDEKIVERDVDGNIIDIDMTGWNAHMRTHIRLNQPVCRGDLLKCNNQQIKYKKPWIPIYI